MTHRGSVPGLLFVVVTFLTINSSRASGWMPDGNPLAVVPRNQIIPAAAPDGNGGAIVVWMDSRGSVGDYHPFNMYAQRIDAFGNTLWAENGVPISTAPGQDFEPLVIADGSGGAIIVWRRTNTAPGVYAQRIDALGNPLWSVNGIPVDGTGGSFGGHQLMTDNQGGAIIAWYRNADIYVQRINAAGNSLWTANGLGIGVNPGRQYSPVLATDGVGGAIVAWVDTVTTSGWDIKSGRVSSEGALLWTPNSICTAPSSQLDPSIVDDGQGGAIVAWVDYRGVGNSSDAYMQRINGFGDVLWTTDGAALSAYPGSVGRTELLRAGNRVLAMWGDSRNGTSALFAQSIELSGNLAWGAYGIPICEAPGGRYEPRMVSDGGGGAIIAWTDSRNGAFDVYAQRLGGSAQLYWLANGIPVSTANGHQHFRTITQDGAGGAILAWSDARSGVDPDVYAQHLDPSGLTLTDVDRTPSARGLNIVSNRPNPFGEMSVVEVELDSPSDVTVSLFDVGGRQVREERWPSRAAGSNRFDIQARDQDGRILPSGVYFLRVTAGASTATRKIVITR